MCSGSKNAESTNSHKQSVSVAATHQSLYENLIKRLFALKVKQSEGNLPDELQTDIVECLYE